MTPEKLLMYARDAGCIIVGLGGIVHQTLFVPAGQANAGLLTAFVAILGIPTTVGLLSLRSGGQSTTAGSSSSPPEPSPQPEPSSPSSPP
ncbi:hypothetical protein [Actinoplanes sp. NPDC049316]|uniref:hypothetical protein n=1 Tax=Actinoplanes sp. NPDC049316 TaxID=3154727 RepID=UPI003423D1B6